MSNDPKITKLLTQQIRDTTDLKERKTTVLHGRKYTILDDIKDVGRMIKLLFVYFRMKFSSSDKRVMLKHKFTALKAKQSESSAREIFHKKLLVGAINQPAIGISDDALDVEKNQLHGIVSRKNGIQAVKQTLKKIDLKEVKKGVCFGACIQMAGQLLPHIEDKRFSDILLDKAHNFKNGIGVAGVVNQVMYEKMSTHFKTDLPERFEKHSFQSDIANKLAEVILNPVDRDKTKQIWEYFKKANKEAYNKYVDIKELIMLGQYGTKMSEQLKKLLSPETNKIDKELMDFINAFSEDIDRIYPYLELMKDHNIEPSTSKIKERPKPPTMNQEQTMANINQEQVNAMWRRNFLQIKIKADVNKMKAVAKARGLNFQPTRSQRGTDVNDAQFLNCNIENGVYGFTFDMRKGSHITLLIKTKSQSFLWDPNVGLLSFKNEETKTTILKLFKKFYDKKTDNHNMELYKLTKENMGRR